LVVGLDFSCCAFTFIPIESVSFCIAAAPGHSQEELFSGAACKKERKRKEKLRRQQNTPCMQFREQALERLQEKQEGRDW
jgi:hypothetical protein